MSLIKKLAGETAIYGIPTIVSKVLNFAIMGAYFSRIFEDQRATYNDWQQLYVMAAIGLVLFTYRMETTLFRFGSKAETKDRAFTTALTMIIISSGVLCVLAFLFSDSLRYLFLKGEGPIRFIYYFIGIIVFDALAAIPFAKMRLDNHAAKFARLKVVNIMLNIVLVLSFLEVIPRIIDIHLVDEQKLDLIFMANLITSLVVLILVVPTIRTIKSKWIFDTSLVRKMIIYTWPLGIIALAGVFNQYGQFPLLQWILPEDIAKDYGGTYAAATKLAIFMTLFTTAFNYAAEPFFFKQAQSKEDVTIYGKVAVAYTLVAVGVFLGVTYYMDIIQYILGSEMRDGVGVVPIVMLAYLFLGLYYNVSIWYKLSDNTQYGMYISLGGAVITILLNMLLIPQIGYYGSAWATFGCYALMLVACYLLCQLKYPISYPVFRILKYIAIAIIFWQISEFIRPQFKSNLPLTLAANTTLLLLFGGLIYAMDQKYLKGILK